MPSYDTNRPLFDPPGRTPRLASPMTPAVLGFAGVAAIIGLVLGLTLGWLVWPVQWTNAWPADLSDEARAHYLAAVAESYVYYGDAQAAEVARNRLFDLNEDLATYIAEAQTFFIEQPQPNSAIYISNLGQLAQALGVQSPDIITDAPAPEVVVVPATETAGVDDTVRAWINWMLAVLAAIVLVGGGFYIVGRLSGNRTRQNTDMLDDDGSFDDEVVGGLGYIPAAGIRTTPAARPLRGGPFDVSSTVAAPPAAQRTQPEQGEEYSFDEDTDDDVAYAHSATLETLDYRREDELFGDEPDVDQLEAPLDDNALYAPPAPKSFAGVTQDADIDDEQVVDGAPGDEIFEDDLFEDDEQFKLEPVPTVAAVVRQTTRPVVPLRTLGSYTLHYQAGIPDYDQAYSIIDPTSGLMVGDVGMGISSKNNAVQSNPDNVVALDLWLVDKKDDKTYSSQDRILLSEYAVDHKLESSLTRDRGAEPAPIIPQSNLSFQIKGPSLLVDCLITEAGYFKSGPAAGMFQNLRIEVTVRCKE